MKERPWRLVSRSVGPWFQGETKQGEIEQQPVIQGTYPNLIAILEATVGHTGKTGKGD